MATISSFRELRVHQAAFDAAMRIFDVSKQWPANERYELTGQIRRSSRSVCACTAEAWRKRRYPAAFIAKLNDAEAEAAETRAWLDFALDCGHLDAEEHGALAETKGGGRAPHPQSPSLQPATKEEERRAPSAARADAQSRRTTPRTPTPR